MNRYTGLIISTFLTVLIPLTGFMNFWRSILTVFAGLVALIIAVILYRQHLGGSHFEHTHSATTSSDNAFVESEF